MSVMNVDEQRLGLALRHFSTFSEPAPQAGAVSRLPWTAEDRRALTWLEQEMAELGLATSVDPLGNLWGRWDAGADTSLVMGSHRDSVPRGGAFDGALGVLAALEVVRVLRRAGYRPQHNIEVVAWNDEEGARFGTTLFGSRLYVGALGRDQIDRAVDSRGRSLAEAVRHAGFSLEDMRPTTSLQRIHAYLELHIEQGPILEREDCQIGVVTGVGGIVQIQVTLTGTRLHAAYSGADRHDPVLVAGLALQHLDSLQRAVNGDDSQARVGITVGRLAATSSLINVVPAAMSFTVDVRSPDPRLALDLLRDFEAELQANAADRGVRAEVRAVNDHTTLAGAGRREEPIAFDSRLRAHIRAVTADLHYTARDLPSWAGHDAMALAPRVPSAMIFVPSAAGISHAPGEYTSDGDAARGANVLLHTLTAVDDSAR